MTSRVVPCMSDTNARSSCNKQLSRVDFPAFVSPMIAVGIPFFMALPTLKESANLQITIFMCNARSISFERSANSTSSSLKSSSNSINEAKSSN